MADEQMGQNALLPRSLFNEGVKPGDTITLKVSAIYGDEVEVSASASSNETRSMEESPMMSADEEIEAAAERYEYGS
jgi:hypothetical protein